MATLSSKSAPSGLATLAQGVLADTSVQPNDSPTFAGLTVGSNNYPSSGALSNRNLIINGAMQVDQRNAGVAVTGITSGTTFVADRWTFEVGTCGTWTVQQVASSIAGFGKAVRVTCTSSASLSAGSYVHLYTSLEGQDVQQLLKGTTNAKDLSLSFPILCNDTKTFVVEIRDRDNDRHICGTMAVTSGGVEQDVSFNFAGDTTGSFDDDNNQSLQMVIWLAAGSNYSSGTLATSWASRVNANRAVGSSNIADATSNYFEITGVQLEVGDTATPFEHRSYGLELALCQRYYREYSYSDGGGIAVKYMTLNTTACFNSTVTFQEMRASPTLTELSAGVQSGCLSLNPIISKYEVQTRVTKSGATGVYRYYGGSFSLDAEL